MEGNEANTVTAPGISGLYLTFLSCAQEDRGLWPYFYESGPVGKGGWEELR